MTRSHQQSSSDQTASAAVGRGCVVAFAGHMVDACDRPAARFPSASEGVVTRSIAEQLHLCGASHGVCSLACGADILFAEQMLARGGTLHVILPISQEEFVRESVVCSGNESWLARFQAVLGESSRVKLEVYGNAYLSGSGTPFHVTTLLIDGNSQLCARAAGLDALSLAVWDGEAGDGHGGTASFVGHAVMQGRAAVCIDPLTGRVFAPGADAVRAAARHSWARLGDSDQTLEHRLVAMLFADAKGFSGLTEPQMPGFIREVLGAIARAVAGAGASPRVVNTWGDGVFMVTDDIEHAGRLALALIEESAGVDCTVLGTDHPITFRVGLHAGPAFVGIDPITGRTNAYGADVSLAARIEPVTNPGEVWASKTFVGLAAATGSVPLVFDCLGRRKLAKGGGSMELFRVGKMGQTTAH